MEVYGVVYVIWNLVNGKCYVGQTIQPVEKRMAQHRCGYLCVDRAIQKYGWENFRYCVLEACETQEQLNEREKFWVAALDSKSPNGYNCTDGGDRDFTVSDDTRAKLSAIRSKENNPFFGKHLSADHRRKIAESHMGPLNPNFGKTFSADVRKKMGDSHRGKHLTDETKAKIAAAHMGEVFTDERCTNISVARRGPTPFKNLAAAITERKFTYRKLAKLMGVSSALISMLMTGRRNFTDEQIAKLVEIFGLPAEYLMQRFEI